MDGKPRNSEATPFKLPEVQVDPNLEYPGGQKTDEKYMSQAVEKDNANPSLSDPATLTDTPELTDDSQMVNPMVQIPTQATPKQITVTDDIPASETDLIEKAWVIKAKAIVAQTKDDPYEQTNELKKIKADYQHKRFKTDLKIDGE